MSFDRPWVVSDDTYMGLVAEFIPMCPYHEEEEMKFVESKLLKFALEYEGDPDSHAVDVVVMCPECGYTDVFGVAISKEHWDKVQGKITESVKEGGCEWAIMASEKALGRLKDSIDTSLEKNQ